MQDRQAMGTATVRHRDEDIDHALLSWLEARLARPGRDAPEHDLLDYLVALVLEGCD